MRINSTFKNKIIGILKQPYPFYFRGRSLLAIVLLIFSMSLFFNYLFEPFEVYVPEHKMPFFWISFIHATSPVLVLVLMSLFLNSDKTEDQWTISKEIIFVFLFIFFTGLTQFLIRDLIYDNPNNWSMGYLLEELRNTFLVGSLFIMILVPLNFNRLYAKNLKSARSIDLGQGHKISTHGSKIQVKTQLKGEEIELDLKNFLYAKADGNYVMLYLRTKKIENHLKRIPIKELEQILRPYPYIIKTHRSFLVNTRYIKNINGNAQGYKLKLEHIDQAIPVSRNMIDGFNKKMNDL